MIVITLALWLLDALFFLFLAGLVLVLIGLALWVLTAPIWLPIRSILRWYNARAATAKKEANWWDNL